MNGKEIRQTFLDFFAARGHRVVRSSPLVPENDPTLLFANAGMNQFKNVFLGVERREYNRAASCQKCVRAGGKHNDLENVGRTARHHTFFEMLGNFSFGDYFKDEAIRCAWDLVTGVYGLNPDRLVATVFREDDEAFSLWQKITGLPEGRILRLGEKDNFWAMGDTGPCGPCSEILYDLGVSPAGHAACAPDCDCGRYLEIWNLVFMQYERGPDQVLKPLPKPSIDTGMGLERITSVMQGHLSNYDTDLFMPIIHEVEQLAEVEYGAGARSDISMRIIADHSRAGAFLASDGVIPSNEGRGYVLRKILRRAIRHGKLLGLHEPFLYRLTGFVTGLMGDVYDELVAHENYVARVIRTEEEKFISTLEFGLRKLEEIVPADTDGAAVAGNDIFRLYDTFGFPLDLLQEIAAEKDWQLDMDGFQAELEKQKDRARASWKGDAQFSVTDEIRGLAAELHCEFRGYETLAEDDARILAILSGKQRVEALAEDQPGEIILDRTPFYAEAGGQIGDHGYLRGASFTAQVLDTVAPASGLILHRVKILKGEARPGQLVRAEVDEARRLSTASNHTATHLLHAALRDVLGVHVKQAGSLVAPERFRFDFTHFTAVSPRELEIIEEMVNEQIWQDRPVRTDIMPVEKAIETGAMALFGEKYQEVVRVVSVEGFSRELCGGTHLQRTGQTGVFKIVAESSIASGIRRIEGLTGRDGYRLFVRDEKVLEHLSRACSVDVERLPDFLAETQEHVRARQKEIDRLRLKLAGIALTEIERQSRDLDGVRLLSGVVTEVDRNVLRALANDLLKRHPRAIVALGAEIDHKAALVVMVTPEISGRFPAGRIIGALAQQVGGGGGGKPAMAEAGGKNPARLPEALGSLPAILAGL